MNFLKLNIHGDTPLHELIRGEFPAELVLSLLKRPGCKADVVNNKEQSLLSLACSTDSVDAVKYLLNFKEVSGLINREDDSGQSPIALTTNLEIVSLLLDHGAVANPLLKMYGDFFHEQHSLPQTPVSLLVIGHPYVGKTTLISSLKKENEHISSTSDVFARTAGIVPSDFNSPAYGQVTIYDFAGQPEYYASHDTVIHRTIKESPPIVLLVVKLTDSTGSIVASIKYWTAFVKNRLTSLTDRAHLYIICSHADLLESDPKLKINILQKAINVKSNAVFVFQELLHMNCTDHHSSQIEKLRSSLIRSTKQLRRKGFLNFRSLCLSTFLKRAFKNEIIIPLEMLLSQANKEKSSSNHPLVPKTTKEIKVLCKDLNTNGIVIFLENPEVFHRSWLILNKAALLADVSGTLFAPSSFPEYIGQYGSSTGVVSFSKMRSIFPQYDPNMLFDFLCQMEYCQEIKDEKVIESMLNEKILKKNERYFFFPNVIRLERPPTEWTMLVGRSRGEIYQFGWIMKCTDGHFSPSFIQVLLLRLMFGSTDIKLYDLNIHSMSTIWKSGIMWSNTKGINTVVDVIENSTLLVLIQCNVRPQSRIKFLMHCLQHRSSLLRAIRTIKCELCPAVETEEFFIIPKYIHHPLKSTYPEVLIPLSDVLKSITNGDEYIYSSSCDHDQVELKAILVFDPYSNLCNSLSKTISNPDNAHKPRDEHLIALANHLSNYYDEFVEIISPSPTALVEVARMQSPVEKFQGLFERWLNRIGYNFEAIKKEFDKVSLFQEPPGKFYLFS